MADNVNVSANVETILKYLENNSQVNDIDVTDIESIFEQLSSDNQDVSTEEFINTFNEYFMVDTTETNLEITKEEYLAALSEIVAVDGNSETISAKEINALSNAIEEYNSNSKTGDSFNIDDLDMSEWSEIESKENKTLFGKSRGTYTYTASNGTKVTVENSDGAQILENKETGEILVIGAEGAEIKGSSKDNTITVYDSEIDSIETGKGADNIKVYSSTVDTIKTGKGTDSIYINDSTVESLNTGAGSDFVSVTNSDTSKINTSSSFLNGILDSGEDTVMLNDSTTETLKTGRGDDTVVAEESSVTTLKSGAGSDSLSLDETEVETLKTGDKDITIEDGNYLDFDTSKISEIESEAEITLTDGSTMSLTEYTDYILNQEVGFETEEEYEEYVIETLTNNLETMKSVYQTQEDNDGIVSDGYNILKELSGLGISSDDVEAYIEEQETVIEGLTAAMNGESSMTFEEAYEYYTGTTYSQEKIDNYIEVSNTYSAVMIGCQYDEDYADKFEEATGISVNDLATEFALCQTETFGQTSELEELVNEYSEDQESFKDNLSAVISTTGIICMVAGAVICVACPVAAGAGIALMNAGKAVSLTGMFIDNGLDLIDDSTDADGLTKEEAADIALETGVEAVSYAAGRGIGKLTNGLNTVVANKVSEAGAGKIVSYVAGQTAETVADTALSLGADYAIAQGQSYITTGEFMDAEDYWSLERFTGEGRNQLIGILTGLASSKVSAYQQTAIASAQTKILSGDTEGAKTDLEAAGIKTTDASFDDFVEQVKAVDEGTVKASSSDMETVDVESETVKTDSETDSLESVSSSKTETNIEETDIQTKNAAVESESTEIKSNDTETSSKKAAVDSTDELKTSKVYNDSSEKTVKTTEELVREKIAGTEYENYSERFYNNLSRAIDCTYERLNNKGIQVTKEDILSIAEKFDYDASNIITTLSSISAMDGYFSRMVILDKLIDNEIVTMDMLEDVTGTESFYPTSAKYLAACEDETVFNQVIKAAGLEEQSSNISDISAFIQKGELSVDNAKTLIDNIKTIDDTDIDLYRLDETQQKLSKDFLQKFTNSDDVEITREVEKTELQNGAGTQVKTTVSWNSKFVDEETGDEYSSKIKVTQTIEPDGTVKIERTETYEDGTSKSWYIDGDSTFDTVSTDYILTSQTEIIYNQETGEPESVLVTKKSDSIEGVYEKTQYTLEDYPEDYDVLKGINDGTIEGGTQLSKVTANDDGSKTYSENVSSNGSNIQRTYAQGTNGTDYDYRYTITDKSGTQILDTSVSFTKNSDNQTTTVINGVEYVANFDDTTHIIEITGSDGTTKTIDISKLADSNLEECWQTAKNLSSDSLETLSLIGKWTYIDDNLDSCVYDGNSEIKIKDNAQIISHELGHAKDYILSLSDDTELIKIYNSEIESFNSEYTDNSGQNYIEYFSQTGGSKSMWGEQINTGLSEVVAETNMLLTNYGHNTTEVESRAQFLVQNFPKTMAYIADKFGLNAAEQE